MSISFTRGVLFGLVAVTLWGAQLPMAKAAFAQVDLMAINVARYGVAAIVLTPIFLLREGRVALGYEGRFWHTAFVGVVGMALSALLVFWGLSYTLPENAVVILALQPSLAAIAGWLLHGRRPPVGTQLCIAIAFAGVIMVVTKGAPTIALSPRELLGDLLVLLGACCWVGYTLAAGSFGHWTAMRFTYLTMLPAAAFILVLAIVAWLSRLSDAPTAAALWSVAPQLTFLSLAGVVAAMLLWNAANQRIGGLNSTLLLNLMPVVTFAVRFLQGQRFSAIEVLGALLVVGALVANNLLARHDQSHRDVPAPKAEP